MKLTIGVANFNKLENFEKCIYYLLLNTSEIFEIICWDNNSTDDFKGFCEKTIKENPGLNLRHIRVDSNLGVSHSYNSICKEAKGDWIALIHNDLHIHEKDWDKKLAKGLEEHKDKRIGMVGFGGGTGIGGGGARIGYASNSIDAEHHGRRMTEEYSPAMVFDGYAIIVKKEMMEITGGFYTDGGFRYAYDYDIALRNLKAGFTAMLLNVKCEHISRGTYTCAEIMKEHPLTPEIDRQVYQNFMDIWEGTIYMPSQITPQWKIINPDFPYYKRFYRATC